MGNRLQRQFAWTDRRPIASLFISDPGAQGNFSTNPARWFLDTSVDVTTPSGLDNFAVRMNGYIDGALPVMAEMNAQGMIAWDIDGSRYPSQSYLGSPDYAERINPELSHGTTKVITNFFARFRNAGYKVGVTLRPTEFNLSTLVHDNSLNHFETLRRKAMYAKQAWGCRLFYIDTNTEYVADWPILPATTFARLHQAMPDCLFIPEHEDIPYHLWTAPYRELRMGETGTPGIVTNDISDAFSVIFCSAGDIAGNMAALRESRKRGDIMLLNGWWRNPAEIDDFKAIYT